MLDAGCGTGDTALYLAARGHRVLGIDFAPTAVAAATRKAAERGLGGAAAFLEMDALAVGELRRASRAAASSGSGRVPAALGPDRFGPTFDTILDVGLFHTLQPAGRRAYARALRAVVAPHGRLLLLAWSDRNPFGYGPERVQRRDLRHAFAGAWRVESIEEEELETRLPGGHVHAWLARLAPR